LALPPSKPTPQFSAFISHAKADAKKAQAFAEGLEARGFKCWIAPRDVKAGRSYGDEIIRGIENAKVFVLVLSKASNESAFVAREVERAVSKKKPVLAVRIADVDPAPALELFVASTQWIDAFRGKLAPHIDRLAERLAEEEGVEPSEPKAGATNLRKILKWTLPAGAAAALLLALGAFLILRPGTGAQTSHADYQACDTGTGNPAIEACDRAIGSGAFDGQSLSLLYNGRGYLRMMSGDLDRGLADLNEAIRIDPAGPYPYWNRAEIYRYKGDTANAKADYEKALALGPKEEDRPKIEAALRGLASAPPEKPDPFMITDPSRFSGGQQEGSAAATEPAYPADAMPASPPDLAPDSSYGPAVEPPQ
jgi:tetratricopeptide (TPR) repeat protein